MEHLEGIDLNWLRALSYLLETRSVSAAARKAGVSQPAMSRTLAHLRRLFHDPLLVQAGRHSLLSEHAQSLQPKLQDALAAIQATLGAAPHFVPESSAFELRVAANDYVGFALLGPWAREVSASAPNMRLFLDAVGQQSVAQLATGELDFVIGPAIRQPALELERFVVRELWQDRYVCVMRADHPCARGRLQTRTLLKQARVGIDCGGWRSGAEAALSAAGYAWPTRIRVPSFLQALMLVRDSDAVALVPERMIAADTARWLVRPLPFPCEPFAIYLAWHPRSTTNPRHRWLRGKMLEFAHAPSGGPTP